MKPAAHQECTAFSGVKKIAEGSVLDVALKVKRHLDRAKNKSVLVFDNSTSAQVELDLRGTTEDIKKRFSLQEESEKPTGPGRPKLGVISREISLLPRHWEWLNLQPGGASSTLRKLVDEARKKNPEQDRKRRTQEAAYKFMTVMAGDLPQYEEALRALYADDKKLFKKLIAEWPKDIQEHLRFTVLNTRQT